MSKTKSKFDDIKIGSKKLRKLWHQEVDNIFDKTDSMSQSHREENLTALQTYLTEIKKVINEMNVTVKQNDKILKSKKLSELRNYRSKVKEYQDLPEHYSHMPTLGSKKDMEKELSIEIGNFRAILKQLQQANSSVS